MSKNVLKISEVAELNNELVSMNKEKDISFVVKYNLSKLREKTQSVMKKFEEQRLELFKKYRDEIEDKKGKKTGQYQLQGAKGEEKGLEELKKLLDETETFEDSYKLDDFKDLKTDKPYNQIMKFMK